MNQKTSKMLRRFAAHEGRKAKEIKRAWVQLPHGERGAERVRMKREIGAK
jgi:hypothetical protein